MNAQQRELFRLALLRVLENNQTGRGLGAQALKLLVGAFGFTPSESAIDEAIEYLEGKGFIYSPAKSITPESRTWRITDAGLIALENHG